MNDITAEIAQIHSMTHHVKESYNSYQEHINYKNLQQNIPRGYMEDIFVHEDGITAEFNNECHKRAGIVHIMNEIVIVAT